MWLNKSIAVFFVLSVFGCSSTKTTTAAVCPAQPNSHLQFVDVFDGSPEEMAILIPNEALDTHGYWSLGYVYDAKRIVTVRCKYANGISLDVKLEKKVQRCNYNINPQKTLSLNCS